MSKNSIIRSITLGMIALCVGCLVTPSYAENRVALVIGNSAYNHANKLTNPANDAFDVASALKRLGFNVMLATDLDTARFIKTIDSFLNTARGADVAVFYYAGHGLQYDGASYLLPVDTKLQTEFAIKYETITAQDIVSNLESASRASIIILDACRNNPLAERLRNGLKDKSRGVALTRGLGRLEAKSGNTLVVYAAAPGQEAQDGNMRNSPFTQAFLKHVETPGLEVEQMLKRVSAQVERDTNGQQQPERLSRLKIELMLSATAGGEGQIVQPVPDTGSQKKDVGVIQNTGQKKAKPKQVVVQSPETSPQHQQSNSQPSTGWNIVRATAALNSEMKTRGHPYGAIACGDHEKCGEGNSRLSQEDADSRAIRYCNDRHDVNCRIISRIKF